MLTCSAVAEPSSCGFFKLVQDLGQIMCVYVHVLPLCMFQKQSLYEDFCGTIVLSTAALHCTYPSHTVSGPAVSFHSSFHLTNTNKQTSNSHRVVHRCLGPVFISGTPSKPLFCLNMQKKTGALYVLRGNLLSDQCSATRGQLKSTVCSRVMIKTNKLFQFTWTHYAHLISTEFLNLNKVDKKYIRAFRS